MAASPHLKPLPTSALAPTPIPGRTVPVSPLSVPAAPGARAGRACPESADQAGPPAPTSAAGEGRASAAPGGRGGAAPGDGLAAVLHLPTRDRPAPPAHDRSPAVVPVALAPARAHRRGPMVRAQAEQRRRRLARQLHPARGADQG